MSIAVPGRTLEVVETAEPQHRGEIGGHVWEGADHLSGWISGTWPGTETWGEVLLNPAEHLLFFSAVGHY